MHVAFPRLSALSRLSGQRLGITQVLADRARHNPEIYRVSVLLAQLSERYHRARKENDKPMLFTTELRRSKERSNSVSSSCKSSTCWRAQPPRCLVTRGWRLASANPSRYVHARD